MTLGKIPNDHKTVDVGGAVFDIRGVTRAESARFQLMAEGPPEELEVAVIAAATDTPIDEVREWYSATPTWAVEELLQHVKTLSRLDEGAQKSG